MTIHEIAELTADTAPHYFDRKTLKFFGQRMSDFKVQKQPDGRYRISAPRKDRMGATMGESVRYFNPINNKLETV